jgi:hypothetical protein
MFFGNMLLQSGLKCKCDIPYGTAKYNIRLLTCI